MIITNVYVLYCQVDSNIINHDAAFDIFRIRRPLLRIIGASNCLSFKLAYICAVDQQIIIIQITGLSQRHRRQPCISHQHINLWQFNFGYFKFFRRLRQYWCIHICAAIVVPVFLCVACPSFHRCLNRLAIFIELFKVVFFRNTTVKFRKITLFPVQFPGYTCNLVRFFIIFPAFIPRFRPHIQRFRQENTAFICAQRQVLNRDFLIQRQKSRDFRTLFFWKHCHLNTRQKIVNKFIPVIF